MKGYGIYHNIEGGISALTELSEKAIREFKLKELDNVKEELLSEVAKRLKDNSIQAIFFSDDYYCVMTTERTMFEYAYGTDRIEGVTTPSIELREAVGGQGYIVHAGDLSKDCPNEIGELRHKIFDLIQNGDYVVYDGKLALITRNSIRHFSAESGVKEWEIIKHVTNKANTDIYDESHRLFRVASIGYLKLFNPKKVKVFKSIEEAVNFIEL